MSEDPIDYARCTLAELQDAVRHIDRVRFPDRASRLDEEIRRREGLPLQEREPISFVGGARWGNSVLFATHASWPFATLSVSAKELSIEISVLFFGRKFTFAP